MSHSNIWRHLRSFIATESNGTPHTIDLYVEFTISKSLNAPPTEIATGRKELKSRTGQIVSPAGNGKLHILGVVNTIIVTTTDPDCQ